MAFTSAITKHLIIGDRRATIGTWTTDTTTGDIDTGLTKCEFIMLQPYSASVVATNQVSMSESLPCDGSAVTIFCDSGIDGYWFAIGY